MLNYFLVISLLTIGIFYILTQIITVPSLKSIRALRRSVKIRRQKGGVTQRFNEIIVDPIASWIAPLIRMDEYRRANMNRMLKKGGYTLTAEKYYARCIVFSALSMMSSFVFYAVNAKIIFFAFVMLSALILMKNLQEPAQKEKIVNQKILKELPQLVSTLEQSLQTDNDIIEIFKKYRFVAGQDFLYDLDILISDFNITNQETALRNLDERLGMPEVTEFVSALIGIVHGTAQREYLQLITAEMRILQRESIQREIDRRPAKIRPFIVIIMIGAIALFMTPIIISLLRNLAYFS